jgi:hypothetical protein
MEGVIGPERFLSMCVRGLRGLALGLPLRQRPAELLGVDVGVGGRRQHGGHDGREVTMTAKQSSTPVIIISAVIMATSSRCHGAVHARLSPRPPAGDRLADWRASPSRSFR